MENRTLIHQNKNEGRKRYTCWRNEWTHIFSENYYGFDDAIMAAVKLLSILSKDKMQ